MICLSHVNHMLHLVTVLLNDKVAEMEWMQNIF